MRIIIEYVKKHPSTIIIFIVMMGLLYRQQYPSLFNSVNHDEILITQDSEHDFTVVENIDKNTIYQLDEEVTELSFLDGLELDQIIYTVGKLDQQCVFNIFVASDDDGLQEILYVDVVTPNKPESCNIVGNIFLNLESKDRVYLSVDANFVEGDHEKHIVKIEHEEGDTSNTIQFNAPINEVVIGYIFIDDVIELNS